MALRNLQVDDLGATLKVVQDTLTPTPTPSALFIATNALEIVPGTGSSFKVTHESNRPVVRIQDSGTDSPVLQFGRNGGSDFVNVDYNGSYLGLDNGLNVNKSGASENQVLLTSHQSSISKSPMDYTFSNLLSVDLGASHSNHHMGLYARVSDSVPGKGDHVAITAGIHAFANRTPLGGSTGGDMWGFYGVAGNSGFEANAIAAELCPQNGHLNYHDYVPTGYPQRVALGLVIFPEGSTRHLTKAISVVPSIIDPLDSTTWAGHSTGIAVNGFVDVGLWLDSYIANRNPGGTAETPEKICIEFGRNVEKLISIQRLNAGSYMLYAPADGSYLSLRYGITGGIRGAVPAAGGTGYALNDVLTVGGASGTVKVTDVANGCITAIAASPAAGGTGYTLGDILTLQSGTRGQVKVTGVSGGVATSVQLASAGRGYATGTVDTTGGTGTGCRVTISTVLNGVVVNMEPVNKGTGYYAGGPYATTGGFGSGCTVDITCLYGQSGTDALAVSSSGRVGIGTTGPVAQTHAKGTGQTTAAFSDSGAVGGALFLHDNSQQVGSGGALLIGGQSGNKWFAAIKGLLTDGGTNSKGDLAISLRNAVADTSLTERVHIASDGKIGLGTASPAFAIEAQQSNATIALRAASAGNYYATLGGSGGYGRLQLYQSGTVTVLIDSNSTSYINGGNVGIGTTSPGQKLEVNGNIKVSGSNNSLIIDSPRVPSSSSDSNGAKGQIAWDSSYLYVKTQTSPSHVWKRVALATW